MNSPYPGLDIITHVSALGTGFYSPTVSQAYVDKSLGDAGQTDNGGTFTFVDLDVLDRSANGVLEKSFVEDFYYRIHIIPGVVNFGNVLSTKVETVVVWNAFFDSKSITDYLEPVSEGLSILEPVSPIYNMSPLEELEYVVTVSAAGTPQFSEIIQWTIDGEIYQVTVTGQRIIVWPFHHNWTDPLTETLEWSTKVFSAFDGSEKRTSLRSTPRRRLDHSILLTGSELRLFQNLLFGWQDRLYAVPIWQDKTKLTSPLVAGATSVAVSTIGRGYIAGGIGLIIKSPFDYEVFEIDSLTDGLITFKNPLVSSWDIHDEICPLNTGILPATVGTSRVTNNVMEASVSWTIKTVENDPYLPDIVASDTYNGYEIILRKPNWSSPVQYDSVVEYDLNDPGLGAFQQIQRPSYPRQERRVSWWARNKGETEELRALFKRLSGRKTAVYIPTWFPDFELSQTAGAGSSSVIVKNQMYDTLVGAAESQKHVMIRLKDGTYYLREITGVSQINDDEESISFTGGTIPVELNTGNVLMICLVHLCRASGDNIVINHLTDGVSTVEMQFTTVTA